MNRTASLMPPSKPMSQGVDMVIVTTLSEEKSVTSLLNVHGMRCSQSAGGKKKPVILADSGQ